MVWKNRYISFDWLSYSLKYHKRWITFGIFNVNLARLLEARAKFECEVNVRQSLIFITNEDYWGLSLPFSYKCVDNLKDHDSHVFPFIQNPYNSRWQNVSIITTKQNRKPLECRPRCSARKTMSGQQTRPMIKTFTSDLEPLTKYSKSILKSTN